MTLKITILGCGNSDGCPAIGNHWGACDPQEPKNRRTRPSIAVQSKKTTLIIDTGPDVRDQLNRENISKIDAVIYTHTHADHVSGIDDLRSHVKRTKTPLDVYATQSTINDLRARFDYQFVEKSTLYPAVLNAHIIKAMALGYPMCIGDVDFIPFAQDHGTTQSLGFRFGSVAYCTDVAGFDERALKILQGVDTWIVDSAGYKMPHNSAHLTLQKLYIYQDIVKARRVILTHLSLGMDYQTVLNETPHHFEPAYDGMVTTSKPL